ncbi:Imelysin [compost metagenome]
MSLVNGTRYGYLKQAINALVDSLASIETVKDRKLGRPMGRHAECTSDKCSQDVEHKYSGLSLQAVSAQLTALRNIFTGGNGMGLDDALIKANRADVARNFLSAIDQAQTSVEAAIQQGTLQEQIEAVDATLCKETTQEDRKASICAVHADIRQVASVLKTEVIVALALTAPPAHQGDKD